MALEIHIEEEFGMYTKKVWNIVGTKKHFNLSNDDIKRQRIYRTIDSIICLRFFNQDFLPYKSLKWWKLWINNRTELDGFGNFREIRQPTKELLTGDAHKIWLDPVPWFNKKKKKRNWNGMGKGGVILYHQVANESEVIKDEKARINWAMVMSHGYEKAFACFYCHALLFERLKTRDHVLPKSRCNGFEANIVCSCHKCNGKKANMTPSEWREQLSGYVLGRISEETRYYYHEILDTLDLILDNED